MAAISAPRPPLHLRPVQTLETLRDTVRKYDRLAARCSPGQADRQVRFRGRAERTIIHAQVLCHALAGHAHWRAARSLARGAWDVAAECEESALILEHQAAVFPDLVVTQRAVAATRGVAIPQDEDPPIPVPGWRTHPEIVHRVRVPAAAR